MTETPRDFELRMHAWCMQRQMNAAKSTPLSAADRARVAATPKLAVNYCQVVQQRLLEAEPAIAESDFWRTYLYQVVKGPWPEVHQVLATKKRETEELVDYVQEYVQKPVSEFEPLLVAEPGAAWLYVCATKNPLPVAEDAIWQNRTYVQDYFFDAAFKSGSAWKEVALVNVLLHPNNTAAGMAMDAGTRALVDKALSYLPLMDIRTPSQARELLALCRTHMPQVSPEATSFSLDA